MTINPTKFDRNHKTIQVGTIVEQECKTPQLEASEV